MDHAIAYTWTEHHQLASVKSLAGEFRYQYAENNPALLTQMTSPVHRVETTREPKRDLITEVRNVGLVGNPQSRRGAEPNPEVEKKSVSSVVNPISSYAYTNDGLGRRTSIAMTGAAFDLFTAPVTATIGYNDRSEVVGATYTRGTGILPVEDAAPGSASLPTKNPEPGTKHKTTYGYAYDAIGNRQQATVETPEEKTETTYTANSLNQYRQVQEKKLRASASLRETSPVHDPDGNLLSDDRFTYTWDAENRLIAAAAKDGAHRVEYGYDHQSRRVLRRTYNAAEGGNIVSETAYLYDDWNVIAELDITASLRTKNQKIKTYTWGRDLSGSLQGAGGVGGLLAISEKTAGSAGVSPAPDDPPVGNTVYPLYDANGNVTQLLGRAGELVAHYEYDPFGNIAAMDGEYAVLNPWRFSTKPQEAETGFLYYGFRYYMPTTVRWASRDPIGEWGGINLYGFVGNDGVGEVDVNGLVELNLIPNTAKEKFLREGVAATETEAFDIGAHGNAEAIFDENGNAIDYKVLVDRMIEAGYQGIRDVKLFSCNVANNGSDGRSPRDKLEEALEEQFCWDITVIAPTRQVWFGAQGFTGLWGRDHEWGRDGWSPVRRRTGGKDLSDPGKWRSAPYREIDRQGSTPTFMDFFRGICNNGMGF